MRTLARTPPSIFAVPFGLAGLAVVWRLMAAEHGTPYGIADALFVLTAIVWIVLLAGESARVAREPRVVLAELRDPIVAPFWSLPAIVGMLLADGLQPHAAGVAKVLMLVFLVITLVVGGWMTAEWIIDPLYLQTLHPGYFLPAVAGGFVAAHSAALFGLDAIGWMGFGIGLICWLMLGSLTLNRLMIAGSLATPLIPTLAIEVAPPALAGSSWFALHGSAPDAVAYAFAGYAVLMAIVQLRLLPLFVGLPFMPSFWAFTFPWAAVAVFALRWLAIERPAGEAVYAALVSAAISLLVAAIAVRSLRAR